MRDDKIETLNLPSKNNMRNDKSERPSIDGNLSSGNKQASISLNDGGVVEINEALAVICKRHVLQQVR